MGKETGEGRKGTATSFFLVEFSMEDDRGLGQERRDLFTCSYRERDTFFLLLLLPPLRRRQGEGMMMDGFTSMEPNLGNFFITQSPNEGMNEWSMQGRALLLLYPWEGRVKASNLCNKAIIYGGICYDISTRCWFVVTPPSRWEDGRMGGRWRAFWIILQLYLNECGWVG